MASIAELGQKVKAKHPGAYDDMDDVAVGRAVKAKFPGAYDDFADAAPPGMGDVQAAPSAQVPKEPTFLGRVMTGLWNTVKPGQYPQRPPVIPRNEGESDKDYAIRQGHADMRWGASPEGVDAAARIAGMTLPGAAPAETEAKGALAGAAESAAVRSLNADRTAFRKAFKGNPDKIHETGRFLLDEKVPLRSPQAARDALGAIKAEEGPKIGQFTKDAGAAGALGDLKGAADATMAAPDVASLAKNTEHRALYDRVQRFLDDQLAGKTNEVTPEVLHDVRKQLDSLSQWDQATPKVLTDAWRTARGGIDDEIAAAMDKVGLGKKWADANARYANASRADDLARIGAERRSGNRLGSPSEKASAVAGMAAGAMHNPVAGVVIPAATVAANRFAMPVSARVLDFLSKHRLDFAPRNLLPTAPGVASEAAAAGQALDPQAMAVFRALQEKFGPRLTRAGAEDDQ